MSTTIKDLVANALYQIKAYTLPAVCERYGLASGTTDEAMLSKTRYIMSRLNRLSEARVVEVGKLVLADYPTEQLRGALEKIDAEGGLVSDVTRHTLAEALDPFPLGGRRDLIELMRTHWPEIDRVNGASGHSIASEIEHHVLRNSDWENSYLLEQVGFLTCSQGRIFKFIEDVVDPVRRDSDEQESIVAALNPILVRDGFKLSEYRRVSGYPVYRIVAAAKVSPPSDDVVTSALKAFNAETVNESWRKALARRASDPEGAITAAKTLLESVCKHIIEDAGETYGPADDLPKLGNQASKLLNLAPSQQTEEVFKTILGNCYSIVSNLAAIRNKLGDSHGGGKQHVKPSARHAELAVNLAGTMAMFLVSTWDFKRNK